MWSYFLFWKCPDCDYFMISFVLCSRNIMTRFWWLTLLWSPTVQGLWCRSSFCNLATMSAFLVFDNKGLELYFLQHYEWVCRQVQYSVWQTGQTRRSDTFLLAINTKEMTWWRLFMCLWIFPLLSHEAEDEIAALCVRYRLWQGAPLLFDFLIFAYKFCERTSLQSSSL